MNTNKTSELFLDKLIFSVLLMISMLLFSVHSFAQKKKLTFHVDLNSKETNLDVQLRGDFVPLSWYEGMKMSDPDKDGVYTISFDFETAEGVEFLNYKYTLNGDDWEAGENRKIKLNNDQTTFKDTFRYAEKIENPFKKFIGKWTLKNDDWEHTDQDLIQRKIKRPNHFTVCKEINTNNSVLFIVDTGAYHGSVFWNYDSDKKSINTLSSFSGNRTTVGSGTIDKEGNMKNKVFFQGITDGRYRQYTYNWVSENEYILKSVEYDKNHKPTGVSYGGTFVRIKKE